MLVRFLPHWQGVGVPRRGLDGLVEVIGSAYKARRSLPRCSKPTCCGCRWWATGAADLDALCTAGEVVWIGERFDRLHRTAACGSTSATKSRRLRRLGRMRQPAEGTASGAALLDQLRSRGASFWADLVRAAGDAVAAL